jgi:hypothetical protein
VYIEESGRIMGRTFWRQEARHCDDVEQMMAGAGAAAFKFVLCPAVSVLLLPILLISFPFKIGKRLREQYADCMTFLSGCIAILAAVGFSLWLRFRRCPGLLKFIESITLSDLKEKPSGVECRSCGNVLQCAYCMERNNSFDSDGTLSCTCPACGEAMIYYERPDSFMAVMNRYLDLHRNEINQRIYSTFGGGE